MKHSLQPMTMVYSDPVEVFSSAKNCNKEKADVDVNNQSTMLLSHLQPWKAGKQWKETKEHNENQNIRSTHRSTVSLECQISELRVKKREREEEFLATIHDLEMLSRMEGPGNSTLLHQIAALRADFKVKQEKCEAAIQELEEIKGVGVDNDVLGVDKDDSEQTVVLKRSLSALQSEVLRLRVNRKKLTEAKQSFSRQVQHLTQDDSIQQKKLNQAWIELNRMREASNGPAQEGFEIVVGNSDMEPNRLEKVCTGQQIINAEARAEKMYRELLAVMKHRANNRTTTTNKWLQHKIVAATALLQQLEGKKRVLIDSYESVAEQLAKLQADSSVREDASDNRIQVQQAELDQEEQSRDETGQWNDQLKAFVVEASETRTKMQRIESEKKELSTKLSARIQDIGELEDIVKAQEECLMDFKSHHGRAMLIIKKLQEKCMENIATAEQLKAEKAILSQDYQTAAETIAQLKASQKQSTELLQKEQDKNAVKIAQLSRVKNEVALSHEKIAQLEREKDVLQFNVRACSDKINDQERLLKIEKARYFREVQQQEQQLNARIADREQKVVAEFKQLTDKLKTQTFLIEKLEQENSEVSKQQESYAEQIVKVEAKLSKQEETYATECAKWTAKVEQLDVHETEANRLRSVIDELKAERDELQREYLVVYQRFTEQAAVIQAREESLVKATTVRDETVRKLQDEQSETVASLLKQMSLVNEKLHESTAAINHLRAEKEKLERDLLVADDNAAHTRSAIVSLEEAHTKALQEKDDEIGRLLEKLSLLQNEDSELPSTFGTLRDDQKALEEAKSLISERVLSIEKGKSDPANGRAASLTERHDTGELEHLRNLEKTVDGLQVAVKYH